MRADYYPDDDCRLSLRVLSIFSRSYVEPALQEGFNRIFVVRAGDISKEPTAAELESLLEAMTKQQLTTHTDLGPLAPSQNSQGGRGRGGRGRGRGYERGRGEGDIWTRAGILPSQPFVQADRLEKKSEAP